MPFEWSGAPEPILETRRRARNERQLDEHHFKWLDAITIGNRAAAIESALAWNNLAAATYGDEWLAELLSDIAHEPANDV